MRQTLHCKEEIKARVIPIMQSHLFKLQFSPDCPMATKANPINSKINKTKIPIVKLLNRFSLLNNRLLSNTKNLNLHLVVFGEHFVEYLRGY